MLEHDDTEPPLSLHAAELTLALDAAVDGQVSLRVGWRGAGEGRIAIPERADQIEWFDPRERLKVSTSPRVVWSAWRTDNGGLAEISRPATDQRASRVVTLTGDTVHAVLVDVGGALAGVYGDGALTRGWCTRAWLIGGAHPIASNVVCWPGHEAR